MARGYGLSVVTPSAAQCFQQSTRHRFDVGFFVVIEIEKEGKSHVGVTVVQKQGWATEFKKQRQGEFIGTRNKEH